MFRFRPARLVGLAALAFAVAALASAAPAGRALAQEKKDEPKVKSKLKVKVPQDDAKLFIEGKETKPSGDVREFETPEIVAGKLYEYAFLVKWEPNNYTKMTRTKTIEFKGGDDVTVDLTQKDEKTDKAEIRWVPTPDDIVAKMIELGGVKDGDIAYEPGPGDGRVLIAAVKKGAKKAVGIELKPEKVAEAKEKVKAAGLSEKITIIEGDALKDRDYSEATIVFLYMGDEFDALLRPILEKQLKPGTRIVSHRFKMGDWEPDKTIKVMGEDGDEYTLHLWTVKEKKK